MKYHRTGEGPFLMFKSLCLPCSPPPRPQSMISFLPLPVALTFAFAGCLFLFSFSPFLTLLLLIPFFLSYSVPHSIVSSKETTVDEVDTAQLLPRTPSWSEEMAEEVIKGNPVCPLGLPFHRTLGVERDTYVRSGNPETLRVQQKHKVGGM